MSSISSGSTGSRIQRQDLQHKESITRNLGKGGALGQPNQTVVKDPALQKYQQECAQWYQSSLQYLQSPQATPSDYQDFLAGIDQMNGDLQARGLSTYSIPAGLSSTWGNKNSNVSGSYPQDQGIAVGEPDPNADVSEFEDRGYDVPTYQDDKEIVTEGAETHVNVSRNETDLRHIHFFQGKNTLAITDSNSAQVTVVEKKDDRTKGKTMLQVTLEYPNGTKRLFTYHNVDRSKFSLNIQTPDGADQVDLSGAPLFKDKIKVTELGVNPAAAETTEEASDEEKVGTDPNKTTATTRTWDKDKIANYGVTTGKELDRIVAEQANIAVQDLSQFADVVKKAENQYEIQIYTKNEKGEKVPVRKIEVNLTNQDPNANVLNLVKINPNNLFFQDQTKGDAELKLWNDPSRASITPQLQIDGKKAQDTIAEAAAAAAKKKQDDLFGSFGPSKPRTVTDAGVAVFDNAADVTLKASMEGLTRVSEITANGVFKISPDKLSDKIKVTEEAPWYVVTVTGSNKDGTPTTNTYKIAQANIKNVLIDAPAGQIDFSAVSITARSKMHVGDKVAAPYWVAELKKNVPLTDNWQATHSLIDMMSNAFMSGNWTEVKDYLNNTDENYTNDIMRILVTGFVKTAGDSPYQGNQPKTAEMLKQIPVDVRQVFMDRATAADRWYKSWEGTEQRSGEYGDSHWASGVIFNSL